MRTIPDANKFRSNVKLLFGEILENVSHGDNLEKGIYNFTLQHAEERNIIKKWNNSYFTQIYIDRFRTIYNNLKIIEIKELITKKYKTS